jgi:predicted nuclease with TOPRIM domain
MSILIKYFVDVILLCMLTKDDIEKLVNTFATKEDLERIKEGLATKKQFEQVIEKLDSVYGELKDFRQEQTVHAGQHEELREDVDSLKHKVTN